MEGQPLPVRVLEKHSAIGIASFAISIAAGFRLFGAFIIARIVEASAPGGMDQKSATAILIGTAILGFVLADILSVVLGLVGLFQRHRNKVFAILGASFAFATLACTMILMAIGFIAKQH